VAGGGHCGLGGGGVFVFTNKSDMVAVVDTKPVSKGARPEHHTQNAGDADVVTHEAGVGYFVKMIGHGVRFVPSPHSAHASQ
jgi:hypothetical protein